VSAAVVVVVGSANVDRVLRVQRIPAPGETVLATGSSSALGGKGQNQAVAAARAGAATAFIAAVGDDPLGERVRVGLAADGIDASLLRVVDSPTGTALIAVDDAAENTIIVDPGANAALTGLSDADVAAIAAASVLVLQLEIPLPTVTAAIRVARDAGTTTVLNAAPIRDLPDDLLSSLDVLVVNEHEAAHLAAGRPIAELTRLVPAVIVTLGSDGAQLHRRGMSPISLPAPRVHAIDATGAGDTFCGALAAELAAGGGLEAAMRFAIVAASLSVERAGAVPSVPMRDAVLARVAAGLA
jgi:ribokinase